MPTKLEISAGGVAFRRRKSVVEVALISVGEKSRWQLPKGLVDKGESTEAAALREVLEEAGIETRAVDWIDKIEYWYFARYGAEPGRIHKFVHFYLLEYCSGDVRDHDSEVNEARWVEIGAAIKMLAFDGEKKIVEKAKEMIGMREE
jgi:8-oxo-dGTP pyrophosphatase MutT (NUDIX family)